MLSFSFPAEGQEYYTDSTRDSWKKLLWLNFYAKEQETGNTGSAFSLKLSVPSEIRDFSKF